MSAEVSPRLRAILVGSDPMLRFLVRESLQRGGVMTESDVATPREISPKDRHEHAMGVVVVCLSGRPETWNRTIADARRTLPAGRVVAVTFSHDEESDEAKRIDTRLGADSLVRAPATPGVLRDAVVQASLPREP